DPVAVGLLQASALQLGHRQRTASVRTLPYRLISRYAALKARAIRTPAKGAAAANATVELFVLNSVPSVYMFTGSRTCAVARSPSVNANTSTSAAASPGRASGTVTRQKLASGPEPSARADSS